MSRTQYRIQSALALVFSLQIAGVSNAADIPAPACYIGYVKDLRQAIGNVEEANDFFLRIGTYNDVALEGSATVLRYVGGVKFHETFGILDSLRSAGRHPFATDAELLEVVGHMAADGLPGINRTVSDLGKSFSFAQGAAFDLYIARKLAGEGTNYRALSALQYEIPAGSSGLVRRYDISASGLLYENKSWTQGLPSPSAEAFTDFMDEFRKDIVIDGPNNFARLRFNFHSSVDTPEQMSTLRTYLLQQFDSDMVKQELLPGVIDDARKAFETAWESGTLVSFHSF